MVDSPVEIGTFRETDFDESGAHFRVVIDADPADYNAEQIKDSLRKIAAAAINWMNDRPFSEYIFFYHFPRGPAGGGMEHAYATAIDLNAGTIQHSLYPLNSVSAHEFFHLWNVKRIRPQSSGAHRLHQGKLHACPVVQRRGDQHCGKHYPISRRLDRRKGSSCRT